MNIYNFLVTIPDRLYPFGGKLAYDSRISFCKDQYGYEFFCKDLFYYREITHLLGAVIAFLIFLLIKKYVSQRVANISIIGFSIYLLFQELYLHPTIGGQLPFKGLTDLVVWLVPLWIAIFYEEKLRKSISHIHNFHKLYISFFKSDLVSLGGGLIDYSVLTLSIYVLNLPTTLSIVLGVFMGGITYFTLANLWVFKDTKRKLGSESWRFLIVWFTSLVLNTLGTSFLYSQGLGILVARILTSVVIATFWNFPFNRFWVFSPK